jgi:hypothetical protein
MLAVAESYENGNPGARDARRHPATARPFRYAAVRSAPRTVGSPRTELGVHFVTRTVSGSSCGTVARRLREAWRHRPQAPPSCRSVA